MIIQPKQILLIVLAAISNFFLSYYLQFEPRTLFGVVFFLLTLKATAVLKGVSFQKRELIAIGLFVFLFDLSLIFGFHITITGSTYNGSAFENYISPYSIIDLVALVFIFPGLFTMLLAAYSVFIRSHKTPLPLTASHSTSILKVNPLGIKTTILLALIPFICWIPYLLIYWPGFIFGDTLSSLAQATGLASYSNHHPFLYTMFIKACLKIGNILGIGNTGGCVLYCLVQMGFMAYAFAYLSRWITTRCSLKNYWVLIVVLIFSLSPYIATYSIAMWKDPFFSTALVLTTVLLMDFILSKGTILKTSKAWLPCLAVLLLIVMFSRNNGIYIIACIEIILLVYWLVTRKKFGHSFTHIGKLTGSIACTLALCLVVTGPVYRALDVVSSPKVESVGILLNQMARVAALDGDMTESDREYLNSIVPLDEYKTLYSPTCTDNLKWSTSFNSAALEDDFFGHWLSLFIQNPRVYFEAWELQTFGFWTVNQSDVYAKLNIISGVPHNTIEAYTVYLDTYQINAENKLGHDSLRDVFPQDSRSIPISVIFWSVAFLSICLCLSGRARWVIALVPSLALLGTLIVASPIWYWPRYGAAVQFLIPFYVALVVMRKQDSKPADSKVSSLEDTLYK